MPFSTLCERSERPKHADWVYLCDIPVDTIVVDVRLSKNKKYWKVTTRLRLASKEMSTTGTFRVPNKAGIYDLGCCESARSSPLSTARPLH